jgi:hypothetical protein
MASPNVASTCSITPAMGAPRKGCRSRLTPGRLNSSDAIA